MDKGLILGDRHRGQEAGRAQRHSRAEGPREARLPGPEQASAAHSPALEAAHTELEEAHTEPEEAYNPERGERHSPAPRERRSPGHLALPTPDWGEARPNRHQENSSPVDRSQASRASGDREKSHRNHRRR